MIPSVIVVIMTIITASGHVDTTEYDSLAKCETAKREILHATEALWGLPTLRSLTITCTQK